MQEKKPFQIFYFAYFFRNKMQYFLLNYDTTVYVEYGGEHFGIV